MLIDARYRNHTSFLQEQDLRRSKPRFLRQFFSKKAMILVGNRFFCVSPKELEKKVIKISKSP